LAKKKVIVDNTKVIRLEKPSTLVELHAKEFSIDLKVQRELNEARAEQMAENFQPHALGIVTASKREDGHIYCLDGGHRISAARKARYDGLIATRLFTGLTLKEEAELFLTLNNSRAVQPIDRFKVRVTKGEPVASAVNRVLETYGLHVDWASNSAMNTISAISTLEKVYAGAGVREKGEYPDLVDNLIKTLFKAYAAQDQKLDRATFSRTVLEGLGIFIATFGKRIDYDRLVYVLQGTTPRQIVANTRTLRDAKVKGASLGMNAATVFWQLYNSRNRQKLPDFNQVEPKNDSYHLERKQKQDPLYVDPNQYVMEDVMEKETANA
jgi:hypothetical protein